MLDVSCDAEDVLIDEEVEGELSIAPGGQPFVVAAWLAQHGCQPTVVGALSTRASGVLFRALAREYGVELQPQLWDLEQGIVLLVRHLDGRASKVSHAGVTRLLNRDAIDEATVADIDAVYISGYAFGRAASREAALLLCTLAHARGLPLFVDLSSRLVGRELTAEAWRRLIHQVEPTTIFATAAEIKATLDDEQALAGAAVAVVIKRGKAGLVLVTGTERSEHAAVPVDVVDASGCGDALAAAFMATWLRSGDPTAAATAGLASAARCAARRSALPQSTASTTSAS
jgi:sugar/nucleoside kinase (ribokinase family)